MKACITLTNGDRIDPLNIDSNTNVPIEHSARVLSNTCRFAGHLNTYYSVASHSVYASYLIERYVDVSVKNSYALAALLHEAGGESILGLDFPSPVKGKFSVYSYGKIRTISEFEKLSTYALLDNWGLGHLKSLMDSDVLKKVDNQMCELESREFKGQSCLDIDVPDDFELVDYSPSASYACFMGRWRELNEKAKET